MPHHGAWRPRRPLSPLAWAALAAALQLAACGGGGEPTGPAPVTRVTVSPSTATVPVGGAVQLAATTLGANGQVLTGRAVSWSSSSTAVATVDSTGRVTGRASGQATITATAGGQSGNATVTVTPISGSVVLSGITPDTLVAGSTATLTGTGFSAASGATKVTINGVSAAITGVTATTIQINVPATICQPAGQFSVQVSVSGTASNAILWPLRPASYLSVAVGQETVVRSPSDLCLQFPASSAASTYLIGVQSVVESPSSLTPLVFAGATTGAVVTSAPLPAPAAGSPDVARVPELAAAAAERWQRRRAAESSLRSFERSYFGPRLAEIRQALRSGPVGPASAAPVPSTVQVGDTVDVRVPDAATGANVCTDYTPIETVVRVIGQRGIWLEDAANPTGGYTLAQIQSFSDMFDQTIYPTDVAWFGQPSDLDNNGRVVIVLSKEVNKAGGLLGFVTSADLVAPSTCPSSNEGEVFYGIVPDTGGVFGPKYTVDVATKDAPVVIAHEFSHDIQYSRRINNPNANSFMSTWEAEGQATFAEEVVGDAVLGHASGQNLGYAVAFNDPSEGPNDWYVDRFIDLADYYGFESRTSRVQGAPEQCTFLGLKSEGNNGPCTGNRPVYGTSWSFLRWLTDQFGPGYAGGEQGLQRALVDATSSGFADIRQVVEQPVPDLLPQWAAMLYVDDRFTGMDARLLMTSWNLFDIFDNLVTTAQLTPYQRTFGTFTDSISVRGGSSAYFRVSGTSRPATALRVRSQSGGTAPGGIQLWVVHLP